MADRGTVAEDRWPERLVVNLDPEDSGLLARMAKRTKLPKSEIVRRALRRYSTTLRRTRRPAISAS